MSTLTPNEIELGLERVSLVLERLALQRPSLVLHVAGTNGKGSCVAMLESFLLRNGYCTGAYTSPHLRKYNERIRVAGAESGDEQIERAFRRVEAVRNGVPLTYFEFGTLAALCVFDEQKVDAMVLEVGMGGRLDAVNAVEPDGGIITNVSLDHCEWLGNDVESIGTEKAGILRSGKSFVFGSEHIPATVKQRADEIAANLLIAGRDYQSKSEGASWSWAGQRTTLDKLQKPSLAATVQVSNAASVLALLEALGFDNLLQRDIINNVLGSIELPGRLQTVQTDRDWLLDVAHNAASAEVLADSLSEIRSGRRITAVIGLLEDKKAADIIVPLCRVVDSWIAVRAESTRARPAAELAAIVAQCCGKPCLVADDIGSALQDAKMRTPDTEIILVCGSFYVVGPALDELYSRPRNGSTAVMSPPTNG
jgi:dihydrofolate synthase/folylpolyglutamate synthase